MCQRLKKNQKTNILLTIIISDDGKQSGPGPLLPLSAVNSDQNKRKASTCGWQ
jgi:hypothetical protein